MAHTELLSGGKLSRSPPQAWEQIRTQDKREDALNIKHRDLVHYLFFCAEQLISLAHIDIVSVHKD